MIELTSGAENRLNHYLSEVRRTLAGSTSVDPEDVERDIRDHVEAALAGRPVPVDSSAVDDVLVKLGSPSQWLPESEPVTGGWSPSESIALLKAVALQIGRRIVGGPESYRLAYLSLFMWALGWLLLSGIDHGEVMVMMVGAVLVSFILSRAALSLFGADRLTIAQKWLLYPALLTVYVPMVLVSTLGPVGVVVGLAANEIGAFSRQRTQQLTRRYQALQEGRQVLSNRIRKAQAEGMIDSPNLDKMKRDLADIVVERDTSLPELAAHLQHPIYRGITFTPALIACGSTALTGINWLVVGGLAAAFPGAVRNIFHPFADRFSRRPALILMLVGLFLSLGGVVFIA